MLSGWPTTRAPPVFRERKLIRAPPFRASAALMRSSPPRSRKPGALLRVMCAMRLPNGSVTPHGPRHLLTCAAAGDLLGASTDHGENAHPEIGWATHVPAFRPRTQWGDSSRRPRRRL